LLADARRCAAAAEPLSPTDAEARVHRDIVEQREQLATAAATEGASSSEGAEGSNSSNGASAAAASSSSSSSSGPTSSSERSAEIFIRQTWTHTAELLVDAGRLPLAKRLLVDAQRHAVAFEDREVGVWVGVM
jgi:hypothetical protein